MTTAQPHLMPTDAISELLKQVAAEVILPRWRNLDPSEIDQKTPGDPVTIADREAEVALADAFRAFVPQVLIVGEEDAFANPSIVDELGSAPHAFVIDPIDGTKNFAGGSPDFGVMVAETRAGVTTRSWIWQPVHELLYVAELGAGVRENGVPMPAMSPRPQPYRVAAWYALRKLQPAGFELSITRGACAVDYPRLMAGRIDGLGYRVANPWDHLPGALMVAELGGQVLLDAAPYVPGGRGRFVFAGATVALAREIQQELDGLARTTV
ncbi:MAG TPA: inositol monophosphatase [Propionibacteriaceae bacterium]|nr:inositol monophosphatase [Micropruina sp.]HBX79736.1 inositol monophosphatase [Propionibacteriaceae bacterium]HBY24617.1 inositol monophosphatase [Propionibacteriaceae bacterium]